MSAENATTWNCYNVFGYRLYNYIFVSYFNFACSFVIKCTALLENDKGDPEEITEEGLEDIYEKDSRKKIKRQPSPFSNCFDWITHIIGLWSSVITFLFDGCLLLPYIFTHVIPMGFAYTFLHVIYLGLWLMIAFIAILFVNIPVIKKFIHIPKLILKEYRVAAILLFIVAFGTYTGPVLISTLFNYSQYLYYGEDYFQTMTDEYDSRHTATCVSVLKSSVNVQFHNALNFF